MAKRPLTKTDSQSSTASRAPPPRQQARLNSPLPPSSPPATTMPTVAQPDNSASLDYDSDSTEPSSRPSRRNLAPVVESRYPTSGYEAMELAEDGVVGDAQSVTDISSTNEQSHEIDELRRSMEDVEVSGDQSGSEFDFEGDTVRPAGEPGRVDDGEDIMMVGSGSVIQQGREDQPGVDEAGMADDVSVSEGFAEGEGGTTEDEEPAQNKEKGKKAKGKGKVKKGKGKGEGKGYKKGKGKDGATMEEEGSGDGGSDTDKTLEDPALWGLGAGVDEEDVEDAEEVPVTEAVLRKLSGRDTTLLLGEVKRTEADEKALDEWTLLDMRERYDRCDDAIKERAHRIALNVKTRVAAEAPNLFKMRNGKLVKQFEFGSSVRSALLEEEYEDDEGYEHQIIDQALCVILQQGSKRLRKAFKVFEGPYDPAMVLDLAPVVAVAPAARDQQRVVGIYVRWIHDRSYAAYIGKSINMATRQAVHEKTCVNKLTKAARETTSERFDAYSILTFGKHHLNNMPSSVLSAIEFLLVGAAGLIKCKKPTQVNLVDCGPRDWPRRRNPVVHPKAKNIEMHLVTCWREMHTKYLRSVASLEKGEYGAGFEFIPMRYPHFTHYNPEGSGITPRSAFLGPYAAKAGMKMMFFERLLMGEATYIAKGGKVVHGSPLPGLLEAQQKYPIPPSAFYPPAAIDWTYDVPPWAPSTNDSGIKHVMNRESRPMPTKEHDKETERLARQLLATGVTEGLDVFELFRYKKYSTDGWADKNAGKEE